MLGTRRGAAGWRATAVAAAVLALATVAGCYHARAIAPGSLVALDGYRGKGSVALAARDGAPVLYRHADTIVVKDGGTTVRLRPVAANYRAESGELFVEGPRDRSAAVKLAGVESATVRRAWLDPHLRTGGAVAGAVILGVVVGGLVALCVAGADCDVPVLF
ncbi:MAG TPA: hypothetical protein VG389_04630 [Myxococcota bacterium]|jgi:hypothetical protein|nr:hypothetical protein [Myxococcota bacterium]